MARPTFDERLHREREQEHRLIRQLMADSGVCSVMNNTKWRELCMAMHSLSPTPSYRTKDLLQRPIQPSLWEADWYHHVGPYEPIEWIEIRPDDGMSLDKIVEIVQKIGVVFERLENTLRVYGYTRAATAEQRATET